MYKVFISGKPAFFPSAEGPEVDVSGLVQGNHKLLQRPEKLAKWMAREAPKSGVVFPDRKGIASWDEFRVHVRLMPAAGGAVKDKQGRILFIFRRGHWDLPKGKIDRGESISAAAIREVEEECGIEGVTITGRLPMSYHLFERKDRWYMKPTFWFTMAYAGPMVFTPQEEEDIEAVEWMTASEFAQASPSFPNIRDIASAAFNTP